MEKKKNIGKINIKNMGIDIDKNEYYEIVTSNSSRPEDTFFGNRRRYKTGDLK